MREAEPTVFVVDDDRSVRKALTRLLRSAGLKVTTFACAEAFLASEVRNRPGCLVLDLRMPGLNGLELQRTLAASGDGHPIVFITGHGDIPTSVKAMKAGAVDFLPKPFDEGDLLAAIRESLTRDLEARRARAELEDIGARLQRLSPREREVLAWVVTGALNKQIAAALGTSEKTIKVHRSRVMQKMRAGSLAELVRLAEKAGLSEPAVGLKSNGGLSQTAV